MMEFQAAGGIPEEISAVKGHLHSVLEHMGAVKRLLLVCQSTKADSDTIRGTISSIATTMRSAVRLSATFSDGNGDTYLADTHHSLAEFCGIILYLEDWSSLAAQRSGSQPDLGGFQTNFLAWFETLRKTCERFGAPSQVQNCVLSEPESMDYEVT